MLSQNLLLTPFLPSSPPARMILRNLILSSWSLWLLILNTGTSSLRARLTHSNRLGSSVINCYLLRKGFPKGRRTFSNSTSRYFSRSKNVRKTRELHQIRWLLNYWRYLTIINFAINWFKDSLDHFAEYRMRSSLADSMTESKNPKILILFTFIAC